MTRKRGFFGALKEASIRLLCAFLVLPILSLQAFFIILFSKKKVIFNIQEGDNGKN